MEILARSSYVRRKDMDSVLNCLVTDRLCPGDFTDRFLKIAKERLGFEYGIALRSTMVALDVALDCLGLAPGDSIALSALSQAWAYKVLKARGLAPVWLDVDTASASLTSESLKRMASEPVKALYLAEPWGIMPDPAILVDLGIPVIEDATYSIGAGTGEAKAGFLGAVTIVGLEHACSITAGGGALLFAPGRREAQALRNVSEGLLDEERMGDMNAALALSQVKDMGKFHEKRRELADLYAQSLARSRKRLLASACDCEPSNFGCVVLLESGIKDVRSYAKKKDVDTAMAFDGTCSAHGFVPEGLCPLAASLVNRAVAFPLNQRIGKNAAQKIAKVLATLP
ncbi:MAG: DegT/DnrJ/EryC1/StrS aminotransferase family protein [Spirochaetae bacterium HGW-Spirochaetae-7]|jgi:dTDP-4-amino-4,6-dideoxygalactose transaminase|nr:MAG: DegT/DnrJ/EryC1/StrS aminotransferase family protein [Spirochaetae bacterium HGW-Spirochaetae-7]